MQGNLCSPQGDVAQSKFGDALISSADQLPSSSSPKSALCLLSQTWQHEVLKKAQLFQPIKKSTFQNKHWCSLFGWFLHCTIHLGRKKKKNVTKVFMQGLPSTRVQGLHLQCGQSPQSLWTFDFISKEKLDIWFPYLVTGLPGKTPEIILPVL